MTRRFGWWIIGTVIGITPLAGCAQWGRNFCAASTDSAPAKKRFTPLPPPEPPPTVQVSKVADPTPTPAVPEPPPPAPPSMETADAATVLPPLIAPVIGAPEEQQPTVLPPVESVRRVPLVEAVRCMIEGRHGEALHYLQEYSAPTQEMLLSLLPIMEILSHKGIEQLSAPEADVISLQLQKLSDGTKPRAPLVIDKAYFCDEIRGFGIYKRRLEGLPFNGLELVRVYVEFRNLAGEPRSEGYWTSLKSTMEILDHTGACVRRLPVEGEKPIRSDSFIHDYYIPYTFYVPSLPAGTYTLVIKVVDKTRPNQPREVERRLEFRVTHTSARLNY